MKYHALSFSLKIKKRAVSLIDTLTRSSLMATCHLLITLQTVGAQIRHDKMSGLIWIKQFDTDGKIFL